MFCKNIARLAVARECNYVWRPLATAKRAIFLQNILRESCSSKQTRNSSTVWNLSFKSFLFARENEFDTYVLTGVYLVSSSIYANLGRHMPKHTFDDQEMVRKAMKYE